MIVNDPVQNFQAKQKATNGKPEQKCFVFHLDSVDLIKIVRSLQTASFISSFLKLLVIVPW